MIILKPTRATFAYLEAASIFKNLYEEISGIELSIVEADDGKSDLIVIGADDVNDFCMRRFLDGKLESFGIRYGTDDYCIRSYEEDGRRITIFAGGRARSTVYAVYDYFERFAGCAYFWDGDIIPKRDEIVTGDVEIVEKPRFEYRGMRYFAHRGLKRFQAEHWGFADWKRELDYMIKRRMNFFMLRIGMDDIWQRAFPESVKYADGFFDNTERDGLSDRSDFWTLKYRGELRERVLEYARNMDLDYPADCGTITHWYSPTPTSYLEARKPELMREKAGQKDNTCVWNFLDKDIMEDYIKLTRTMVAEHEKRSDLFHTIGLGERIMSPDPKVNFRLKLIAYRRVMETLRRYYKNSKLFVAGWDFTGFWIPEDVQKLIAEFDPERTIILDYTAESKDPKKNFLNWGVVGKFPWIFGIFHAFCSDSELRGPYDEIDKKLKVAKDDPYCKGMVMWPELAHSDPIILEYLTRNAWSPLEISVEDMITDFSKKRYGVLAEDMNSVWQKVLPFIKLSDWGTFSDVKEGDENYIKFMGEYSNNSFWTRPINTVSEKLYKPRMQAYIKMRIEDALVQLPAVTGEIRALANISGITENAFAKRDAIDIVRTAAGRFLDYLFYSIVLGNIDEREAKIKEYYTLLDALRDLLSQTSDFSLYETIEALKIEAPVNPDFEITLKKNNGCRYNRTFVYEIIDSVYKKECEAVFKAIEGKEYTEAISLAEESKEIFDAYLKTPLAELRPKPTSTFKEISIRIADSIDRIEKFLK